MAVELAKLSLWLVTLAIIRTFEAEDPVRWALVAGLTTGLAYLVRYNVYLSVPIYLVLVIWGVRSRRWLCGLIYVLGFACGYLLVMALTSVAPREIVGVAYDSGGVTTSTITVPLVTALGIGLSTVIRGRNPLVDGFGLIAFASLTPIVFVLVYGMLI